MVTVWVVEPETGAHEPAVLDDGPVGSAVGPGDVDVGTTSAPGLVQVEERMSVRVVDGETMRTPGTVPVPGHHVLVDEGGCVAVRRGLRSVLRLHTAWRGCSTRSTGGVNRGACMGAFTGLFGEEEGQHARGRHEQCCISKNPLVGFDSDRVPPVPAGVPVCRRTGLAPPLPNIVRLGCEPMGGHTWMLSTW